MDEDQVARFGTGAGKPGKVSSKSRSRSRSRDSYSRSRSRSRDRSYDSEEEDELDGLRLHIADIGDSIRKADLEKVFSKYGTLKEVWMTNSTPCFGFAVYKDRNSAADALAETDGIEINHCRIRVSYAKPRTKGSGRRFFNPNMRCYQCGYTGHFYRDCPEANGYKRSSYLDSSGYDRDYDRGYSSRGGGGGRRDRDYDDYGERDYYHGGGGGGGGSGRRQSYHSSSSSRHRSSRRSGDDHGHSSRRSRY